MPERKHNHAPDETVGMYLRDLERLSEKWLAASRARNIRTPPLCCYIVAESRRIRDLNTKKAGIK